jgi:hypothetical protein
VIRLARHRRGRRGHAFRRERDPKQLDPPRKSPRRVGQKRDQESSGLFDVAVAAVLAGPRSALPIHESAALRAGARLFFGGILGFVLLEEVVVVLVLFRLFRLLRLFLLGLVFLLLSSSVFFSSS